MSPGQGQEPQRAERRGRPATFATRRASILRAATEIINRRGVRAMTMAEVANALDLVPTAVGYYFRRKEDLAAACFLESIAVFEELVREAEKEASAEQRLRKLLQLFASLRADIDSGRSPPIAYFNDARALEDEAVDEAYTTLFRRVRAVFIDPTLHSRKRLERNARTHLLISQLYWAEAWLRRYDPADYGRMSQAAADILLFGLARRPTVWSEPAASPPPREEEEGPSREAFLRVATELINEKGFKGASVKEISARLNVTRGAFYHYNQFKGDLVMPCFERTLGLLRTEQLAARTRGDNALHGVLAFAIALVRSSVGGGAVLLRTSALSSVAEPVQAELLKRYDRIVAGLAADITEAMRDGSARIVDATIAANLVISLINASTELNAWAPGLGADGVVEAYVQPLITGLFT